MSKTVGILVDPQKGFCSPTGSLANRYGIEELSSIRQALEKVVSKVSQYERCHLVKSEYEPTQFTHGYKQHPLSYLCVPGKNDDCDVASELSTLSFHSTTIKNERSAFTSLSFEQTIKQDLDEGFTHFEVFGFLFEHCVTATAIDLQGFLSGIEAPILDTRVTVDYELSASRLEKYENGLVKKAIYQLNSHGIDVIKVKD